MAADVLDAFYGSEPQHSQAFGAPRPDDRTHTGDDFSHTNQPDSFAVPAIRGGKVHSIQIDHPDLPNGYGNQVQIKHSDGSRFSYSHLGRIQSGLVVGSNVAAGGPVGTEGSTGWVSGSCVHVEYWDANGNRQDPYPHIRAALSGDTIPEEEDDMPTIIRTAQHGIYTVAPGVCISTPFVNVVAGLKFIGEHRGDKKVTVIDVAPEDLEAYLFTLSGCPGDQIPAVGYAWYAAIAYAAIPVLNVDETPLDLDVLQESVARDMNARFPDFDA